MMKRSALIAVLSGSLILASHGLSSAEAPKITEDEAVKIALETVPGEVTDVAIEKKLGANRYVVEVISEEDGLETDVIIDIETGEVLATEH